VHLIVSNAIVLHRKGNIFPHREAHKLPIRILQHGADDLGKAEDIQIARFLPFNLEAAFDVPLVVKRDQPVEAMAEGALAAAAGANNENLLAGVDLEVDIAEGSSACE
jgi:hypothetical protein